MCIMYVVNVYGIMYSAIHMQLPWVFVSSTRLHAVHMATKALPPKYKFVSEPGDEFICLICLEVAEEPWQHVDCGRLLCKKCLDKLGKDKPCPYCRKQRPQFFPDNRGKFCMSFLWKYHEKNCCCTQYIIIMEESISAYS